MPDGRFEFGPRRPVTRSLTRLAGATTVGARRLGPPQPILPLWRSSPGPKSLTPPLGRYSRFLKSSFPSSLGQSRQVAWRCQGLPAFLRRRQYSGRYSDCSDRRCPLREESLLGIRLWADGLPLLAPLTHVCRQGRCQPSTVMVL